MAVGLLILVAAIAIVLTDLVPSKPRRQERPELELVPPDANNPAVTALAESVRTLSTTVGQVLGGGLGGATGHGLFSGARQFARGAGSYPVAASEIEQIRRNAVSTGEAAGAGAGGGVGGFGGAAAGTFIASTLDTFGRGLGGRDRYDVPVLGAFIRGGETIAGVASGELVLRNPFER